MGLKSITVVFLGLLSGCQVAGIPSLDGPLVLLSGYRDRTDKCRRLGAGALFDHYREPGADLAACPVRYGGTGLFVFETEASQLAEVQGYYLFSVPRH